MGQSMSTPNSPRLNNNKPSLRSLQRTSRLSMNQQSQSTHTQRIWLNQKDKGGSNDLFRSTNLKQRVESASRQPNNYTLKSSRSVGRLKQQLNTDDQIYSPIFKQIPQESEVNEVQQWKDPTQPKFVQKSNSESRHDMTISFSKTKNPNSNPTHEQTLISKENLSKILQHSQKSINQAENEINIRNTDFSDQLYQLSIKQINKECHRQQQNAQMLPASKRDKIKREGNAFNDYDQQIKSQRKIKNKQIKLSPKLQEVKEKIINISNHLQSKNSLLRSISRQNSSHSLRSLRGYQGHNKNKNEQEKLANKVQNKQSHRRKQDQNKQQGTNKQMFSSNSTQFSKKQEQILSVNHPKVDKSKHNSSKLLIFSGSDAYLYAKKEKNTQKISPKIIPIQIKDIKCTNTCNKTYRPTQAEEYDLVGLVSPRKIKALNTKINDSLKYHNIDSDKITKKHEIIQKVQSNNFQQQKLVNNCPIFTKSKDPKNKKRRQELLGFKKRYKSEQNKNLLNSKLLVF